MTTINDTGSTGEQTQERKSIATSHLYHFGRALLFTFLLLGIFVGPALGQEGTETPQGDEQSDICNSEDLVSMIEGFFQVTITLGAIGLVVVWQANSFAELFTLTQQQRQALQRHRRQALRSGLILFLLGPVYTYAGRVMGLPLAECIDLIPLI